MRYQAQTFMSVTALALALIIVFVQYSLGESRMAVYLSRDDGRLALQFRGRRQECAEIHEHLKAAAAIDTSLEIAFIVQHDDVTVSELVDMIYRAHAIGFTNIVIETSSSSASRNESQEVVVIRKIQVIPAVERSNEGIDNSEK